MAFKNPCTLMSASNLNTWIIKDIPKTDRIVFSWKAQRYDVPIKFSFSLLYDTWTPPRVFCEWGKDEQKSFSYDDPLQRFQFFQDELLLLAMMPKKIKIEVLSLQNIKIPKFFASFVASDDLSLIHEINTPSLQLCPKWHYSQIALNLPYSHRICSPMALINASSFFLKEEAFDIPEFIKGVYDKNFDIYGNWMLNTAHAAALFSDVEPKAQRLSSFEDVIQELSKGKPVIASISGQLSGAPLSYPHGHLLVIYGWDNEQKKVLCIDSAAESHERTLVEYDYIQLMESWSKKFRLCYTF